MKIKTEKNVLVTIIYRHHLKINLLLGVVRYKNNPANNN